MGLVTQCHLEALVGLRMAKREDLAKERSLGMKELIGLVP